MNRKAAPIAHQAIKKPTRTGFCEEKVMAKKSSRARRAVITVDFCVELPPSVSEEEISGLMIGGKLSELNVQIDRSGTGKLEKIDAKFVDGYETTKSRRIS